MAPMMVMTSAATEAKIGRAMKKWLSRMGVVSYVALYYGVRPLAPNLAMDARGWRRGARRQPLTSLLRLARRRLGGGDGDALGLDFEARASALQAAGDGPVLGAHALAHHAQAVHQRS